MAKIVYSLKIWMFRKQFHLQKSEEQASRDVSLLASLVYVKSWFRAPDIFSAPASDLAFLKDVCEYQVVQSNAA